jgi:hypothetical protein
MLFEEFRLILILIMAFFSYRYVANTHLALPPSDDEGEEEAEVILVEESDDLPEVIIIEEESVKEVNPPEVTDLVKEPAEEGSNADSEVQEVITEELLVANAANSNEEGIEAEDDEEESSGEKDDSKD